MKFFKNKHFKVFLGLIWSVLLLEGCNNGSATTTPVPKTTTLKTISTLDADQIRAVPLISGKDSTFYFYLTNNSAQELDGLQWSVDNNTASTGATIQDASDCKLLLAHDSCHLIVKVSQPGMLKINVKSQGAGSSILKSWTIPITSYHTATANDNKDALSIINADDIVIKNQNGAMDFFVTNNSPNSIAIDNKQPLLNLPPDIKVLFANCQNPLNFGNFCQMRLVTTHNITPLTHNFNFSLKLNATISSNDNYITLPPQNDAPIILITTAKAHNSSVIVNDNFNAANKFSLKVTPGLPVITPVLNMVANSLFGQNINMPVSTTSNPYLIHLTNNSTISNATAANIGDATLFIPYASLLPANSANFTYAINNTGLSNSCKTLNGNFPSNGQEVLLHQNESCSYYLNITATSSPINNQAVTFPTAFAYYVYNTNSPTHPSRATTSISNNYNITSFSPAANLSVSVASGSNPNIFNGVIEGSASPLLTLTILNDGTKDLVGGISTQNLANPPFKLIFDQNCTNLKMGSSCSAFLTMDTTNLISGNLNSAGITYAGGQSSLPNIPYSVVKAVPAPTLNASATITGCASGTENNCFNNPDTMGGSASAMKLIFNFINTSSTTAVNSIQLDSNLSNYLTSKGFTQDTSSNCNSNLTANGGQCSIVYKMPATFTNSAQQININNYSYTYTASYDNSNKSITSATQTLNLNFNIVIPSITIPGVISSLVFESGFNNFATTTINLNISNYYQANTPTLAASAITTTGTPAVGLDINPGSCNINSTNNSANCSVSLATTSTTTLGQYQLKASLFNDAVSTTSKFNIIPPTIFITNAAYALATLNGIAGADNQCTLAAQNNPKFQGANFKALLISSARYPCDKDGVCDASHSQDWPLKNTNAIFFNPNGTQFNTVNSNLVFDGSNDMLQSELGIDLDPGSEFWLGIQTIHINSQGSAIDAWSYSAPNSNNYLDVYKNYVTSCNNYTGVNIANKGAPPNIGEVGLTFNNGAGAPPDYNNTWGDWYLFKSGAIYYYKNMWTAGNGIASSDAASCTNSQLHLVCVTPF